MLMSKPKVIVGGMIATYPVPGIAWNYLQYIAGLAQLGFEVVYVEDTGLDSYHPNPTRYLASCFSKLKATQDLRWHYRDPNGETHGITKEELSRELTCAELLLNISGGTLLREEYMKCRNKILVDTDPGLNQFINYPKWDSSPGHESSYGFRGHDHFFTYGLCIGRNLHCKIPLLGITWHQTVPPVMCDLWEKHRHGTKWTTVMSWQPFRHYDRNNLPSGVSLGAKDIEFHKYEKLPKMVRSSFSIAVGGHGAPVSRLREYGWEVHMADNAAGSMESYREFISTSRGEFSVAKNIYVSSRSGWFSERSACYLASGKPVILQDTGFSEYITTGKGIVVFSDISDAVNAVKAVEEEYTLHSQAALHIARETFAADKVISRILGLI